MTPPYNPFEDGRPAAPAPEIAAAGSLAAGGNGPGVPLSVWPGLPAPAAPDGPPCGGPLTPEAARRIIDAFTRPGDVVADAGGPPTVAETAAAAGRPVLTLAAARPSAARSGDPAALPPPGDPAAGTAALALVVCHGPGCCARPPEGPGGDPDPGPPLAACERALRRGGVLAVAIAGPAAADGALADTAGSVVAIARAAGLVYAQHIVLLRAAIEGDRLAPAAPGGGGVHDDLLVFTKPGRPAGPAQSGGPRL